MLTGSNSNNAPNSSFPLFGPGDYMVGNELDMDFNILSEYLFNDEDGRSNNNNNSYSTNAGAGMSSAVSLGSFSPSVMMDNYNMHDISDHEGSSAEDSGGANKRGKGKDGKNKDQQDRRRERNRVLARKTRLRKKFFFESLQKQVSQLANENEMLKSVIRQRMHGEIKQQILSECKNIELPAAVVNQHNTKTSVSNILEKADFSLMQAIQTAQRSFVITDPALPDNPIIFASKGFLDLCGYKLEDVLGRNCRFLQGPNTDPKQVEALRKGITDGVDTSVCLLNYRADGSQFYNQIFLAALRDANHKIINYVGVQVEIKQNKNGSMALNSAHHNSSLLSDSIAVSSESDKVASHPTGNRAKKIKLETPQTVSSSSSSSASKAPLINPSAATVIPM